MRILDTVHDVLNHLLLELPECDSYVLDLVVVYRLEDRRQVDEGPVSSVACERLDKYAIVGLLLEVLLDVVDDNDLREVATELAEVFDPRFTFDVAVVSVKPVLHDFVFVDAVYDPVCVLRK